MKIDKMNRRIKNSIGALGLAGVLAGGTGCESIRFKNDDATQFVTTMAGIGAEQYGIAQGKPEAIAAGRATTSYANSLAGKSENKQNVNVYNYESGNTRNVDSAPVPHRLMFACAGTEDLNEDGRISYPDEYKKIGGPFGHGDNIHFFTELPEGKKSVGILLERWYNGEFADKGEFNFEIDDKKLHRIGGMTTDSANGKYEMRLFVDDEAWGRIKFEIGYWDFSGVKRKR